MSSSTRTSLHLTKWLRRKSSRRPPMPRDARGLFEALAHYDPQAGLPALWSAYDFGGVTPREIYWSALGRLPESAAIAAAGPGYDAASQLVGILQHTDFRSGLINRFLDAYPEKKRLIFIHIPKCAGTDLSALMRSRFPLIGALDEHPEWNPERDLYARLGDQVRALQHSDSIAVYGHLELRRFLDQRLLRIDDAAYAVIRQPRDMVLSKVNFMMGYLLEDPMQLTEVVRNWIQTLGIDPPPVDRSAHLLRDYARYLLRHPRVTAHNDLVRYLGRESLQSAYDCCAAADIELTTVTRYEAWLRRRWNISKSERANRSETYLCWDDLDIDDRDFVSNATGIDQQFYDRVEACLGNEQAISVRGSCLGPE